MTSSAIEFPVSEDWAKRAWADRARYQDMYDRSIRDPEGFWGEEGKRLDWIKPYTKVKDVSYSGDVHIRWYEDGTLNACYNCVDRHLPTRADRTAILRSEEHTSELQSLMRISYAVFCLKKKTTYE